MAPIRKGLSYVLGDDNDADNHILPINALQYSRLGRLYSGGRDGVVKEWIPAHDVVPVPLVKPHTNYSDLEEQMLMLETRISSNPIHAGDPKSQYTAANTANYNIHFDWINDLVLVNNDQHLVLCSSDLSLKLIDLGGLADSVTSLGDRTGILRFPNIHTDYVKKLAYLSHSNSLVSGGLDGKIIHWDLATLQPLSQRQSAPLALSLSIYSLAANGQIISTGGPNSVINVYDERVLGPTRRLIGHLANVRCLLMNDNYILSGSSDTTIKLWDLRTFKVFKNFDIHDDAVWSLATRQSLAPSLGANDFTVFYSGDKSGNIIKTDMLYHLQNLAQEFSGDADAVDEKLGISTLVARDTDPVLALCVTGDELLFAATYTALDRFHIPDTNLLLHYQYVRTCVDYFSNHDDGDAGLADGGSESNDLNSDFYDIVSHLSMDTTNIDIQLSLSANYPLSVHHDTEDSTEYTSMFLNVNGGGPSKEYVNTFKEELWNSKLGHAVLHPDSNAFIDETPVEILLNPVAPEQIELIPFNKQPFNKFPLTPKSIISKRLFNNKRWMLVLYLNGDIKIWDIFVCRVVKVFPTTNNGKPMSTEEAERRRKDMDLIFNEHQTSDTLTNWCDVEIKSGKLFVTLKESSVNNVEVYYDELVAQYPFLQVDGIGPDERFHVLRILLNSLFHKYAEYEWEFDAKLRELLRRDDDPRRRMFSRKPSKASLAEDVDVDDTTSLLGLANEDSIMKLLQFHKRRYLEKLSKSSLVESLLKLYLHEPRPLIPADKLPGNLLIIVFESSPELGNYRDVCSVHFEDINKLRYQAKNEPLVDELRSHLPKWVGQPILFDVFPSKESPKIAFQLQEVDYTQLPPDKKIGGRAQRKIKRLPSLETSIKLTSHNMLRVSKILVYLTDKFDGRTLEMKEKRPPVEWLALECKGEELPNNMTLQTIKTKIWKSNSDIELRFRRRFDK